MRTSKLFFWVGLLCVSFFACSKPESPQNEKKISPALAHEILPPDEAVKGESLYQLKTVFSDQEGKPTTLNVYEGHPVVMSMFYASCPYSCPVLIDQLKRLEKKVDDKTRGQLRFVLISFDPAHDTIEVLKEVMTKHGLDASRWKLLRGDEAQVREIAALLGIRFRKIQGGDINHTSLITFLDSKGVIDSQYETGKFSAEEGARRLVFLFFPASRN